MADTSVVVVGGGQAGLAVSHELRALGVDHLVLERGRVAQTWRDRWDSFHLVTPNWTLNLPGLPYDGDDPEGFVPRDEIVEYLERYAASFMATVEEGVRVEGLEAGPGGFRLRTSGGELAASLVVLATGAYQRPHRPAVPLEIPHGVQAIDAEGYRYPGGLRAGRVLVVGSGQTGCQIAEELHQSGRDVLLACGRAPWLPRRAGGRDLATWLRQTSFFEQPLAALPSPAERLIANPQWSGRDGGHDLNYRTLKAGGVQLVGHLRGIQGGRASFADDLADSVAFGDQRYQRICDLLKDDLAAAGVSPPELPPAEPFDAVAPTDVSMRGIGAVVFTSGFRPDYSSWVELSGFDELGFPITRDGTSLAIPGLYFAGVHFLRKRKSSLLFGVGEDAAIVAGAIAQRLNAPD